MDEEISLPEFYVSAKFEDERLGSDRILLKQRGEYAPYVRERTCRNQDENESWFVCSECGASGQLLVNETHYCPNCGAKVVE